MSHPSAPPAALVRHNTRMVTSRRPSSIAELADRATVDAWDESRDFKQYLRLAERYRKEGKECAKRGDLEGAFVELARAATLVLEKLPLHRDYDVVLNADQRRNLGLNGQDILDHLSELKPTLVDRYDKWLQRHPDGLEHERTPNARTQKIANDDGTRAQAQREQFQQEERARAREREVREQQRLAAEEAAKWKQQREQQQAHRKEAAAAAARKAALSRVSPQPDLTFSRTPMQNAGFGSQSTVVISDGRRQEELARTQQQHQRQQEEMRLREEEIARRQAEQKRKHEQEGISRRLQEAEENAQATRRDLGVSIHPPPQYGASATPSTISSASSPMFSAHASSSSLATTPASSYFHPTPGHIEYPSIHSVTSRSVNPPDLQNGYLAPYINPMPLESPRYDGDSTDSESLRNSDHYRRPSGKAVEHRTPTKPIRSPSYPPPITTTSPVPGAGMIRYPTLMSQHQLTQGYYPSLNSIFTGERQQGTSSLLFGSTSDSKSHHPASSAPAQPPYPYNSQQPKPSYSRPLLPPQASGSAPVIPAPPPPPPLETERIIRVTDPALDPTKPLRPVSLPRDCLQRFLGIAKVNTEMNMETCGLLLGKDKGHKYVVTTLLIPKQHSTSDTCTMDEEELVLQFTEERNLITLGWIHTHPSQSCFMSSVDLHTHSGFQRMLPESFAVVCAPKFEPHFGIFRLTDPPGLETILGCTTKEAFHPHPDIPIYTDADKGHVQMKDITLEIVDLR